MIRRIRRSVPGILWVSLILCGIATAAAAADPGVTQHEMRSFVYETLAIAGVVVVGGSAGLMSWILARDRSLRAESNAQLVTAVSELGAGLKRAISALEDHNESEHAHPPHLERAIRMQAQIERLGDDVDRILRDGPSRNPNDSLKRRRADDPPDFDGVPMRGVK